MTNDIKSIHTTASQITDKVNTGIRSQIDLDIISKANTPDTTSICRPKVDFSFIQQIHDRNAATVGSLTEEEILAECKAVRQELYSRNYQ